VEDDDNNYGVFPFRLELGKTRTLDREFLVEDLFDGVERDVKSEPGW